MAQPQEARITCSLCNGWYNSESELRDHMQSAHRRFISEQSTLPQGDAQPDRFEIQSRISREEWANLSVQLRNRVQVHFRPEELDAIDQFILLGSQGSVFGHVRQ
jgi:hypothetical protein